MFSKKWVSAFVIFVLFFFITTETFCQGYAAVPFLGLQQSPLLMGAGQIGASIPTNDAIGFYLNPAQLGYSSRENNLSSFLMPKKNNWFPNFNIQRLGYQNYGISAGYNFSKKYNIPLSIGVGYLDNKFSYGNRINSYDKFDCLSMGAGYEYYLLFNVGFSIKSFQSVLGSSITIGQLTKPAQAEGSAYDFGAMIIAPVSKLFFEQYKYNLNENAFLKPNVAFSLGYSLSNVGKEIYYVNAAQKDPIPRTARLGYTIDLGLNLFVSEMKLNTFNYSFTAEAEDILISRDSLGIHYQSITSDVQPIKHLIKLNGDNNIVVHKGHIFKLFETLILTSGRYHGRGYNFLRTNGIGMSSSGIFKLLAITVNNNVIKFIAKHFAIEYYDTNIFVDTEMKTNINGFAFYFRGFEL